MKQFHVLFYNISESSKGAPSELTKRDTFWTPVIGKPVDIFKRSKTSAVTSIIKTKTNAIFENLLPTFYELTYQIEFFCFFPQMIQLNRISYIYKLPELNNEDNVDWSISSADDDVIKIDNFVYVYLKQKL